MTEPSQEDVQATHRGIVEALEQAIACVKAENALRAVVSRKRLFGTMMSPEVRAQVNTEIGIRGSTFLRIHVAARLAFDSASDAFSKFGEKLKSILPSIPSVHSLALQEARETLNAVHQRYLTAFNPDGTMDQVRVCARVELSSDVKLPEQPQSDLLQIELENALAALPVRTIALVQIKGVYHSSDFMSVNWYGTEFVFTKNQALCIKALWTSLEKEVSSMTSKAILRKAAIKQGTLERVFHNTFNGIRKRHPALGVMIVSDEGAAIRYRLNIREYTCRSQDVLASRTSGDTVGKF